MFNAEVNAEKLSRMGSAVNLSQRTSEIRSSSVDEEEMKDQMAGHEDMIKSPTAASNNAQKKDQGIGPSSFAMSRQGTLRENNVLGIRGVK